MKYLFLFYLDLIAIVVLTWFHNDTLVQLLGYLSVLLLNLIIIWKETKDYNDSLEKRMSKEWIKEAKKDANLWKAALDD